MPENFVSTMAKYLAFLAREKDMWEAEDIDTCQDVAGLISMKIETVRDICAMFNCRDAVWKESMKIYNPKGQDVYVLQ